MADIRANYHLKDFASTFDPDEWLATQTSAFTSLPKPLRNRPQTLNASVQNFPSFAIDLFFDLTVEI